MQKKPLMKFNTLEKIKYIGINLMKVVKDIFNENYQPLKTEIEEDIRRQKALICSWIGRIDIVKMGIHQKKSTCLVKFLSKFQ
jgi:hypothetical protein